ncbi:MAG: hypothetical protein R3C56_39750 [Pirellulaceae bacterium]
MGSYLVRDLLSQGFVPAIVIRDAQLSAEERFRQLIADLQLDPNGTLLLCSFRDTALPDFDVAPSSRLGATSLQAPDAFGSNGSIQQ